MTDADRAEQECQRRLTAVEERLAGVEEEARETRRQLDELARRFLGDAS